MVFCKFLQISTDLTKRTSRRVSVACEVSFSRLSSPPKKENPQKFPKHKKRSAGKTKKSEQRQKKCGKDPRAERYCTTSF